MKILIKISINKIINYIIIIMKFKQNKLIFQNYFVIIMIFLKLIKNSKIKLKLKIILRIRIK